MMEKPLPKCPVCRTPVPLQPRTRVFPFCSEYCQAVDLGRWINEEYRIPVSPNNTERDLPDDEWDD